MRGALRRNRNPKPCSFHGDGHVPTQKRRLRSRSQKIRPIFVSHWFPAKSIMRYHTEIGIDTAYPRPICIRICHGQNQLFEIKLGI